MRRLLVPALFGLTLAATALPTAAAQEPGYSSPGPDRPVIRLVWFDPVDALPVPAQVVAAEVAALFAAWDIDVEWRVGVAGVTATEPPEISVIIQPASRTGRPEIMGEVEPGQDPRAAWISVASVLRTLGHRVSPGKRLGGREAQEFATALSRVVSHEIAHLAAPDLPHTEDGLMQRKMSRADLLAPAPSLEGRRHRRFRARIAAFAADVTA